MFCTTLRFEGYGFSNIFSMIFVFSWKICNAFNYLWSNSISGFQIYFHPLLFCIVPVRSSVCFSKFIFKVAGTSSIRPGKPISDSNVPPFKHVSVRTGKPISNRNDACPSKTVNFSSVSPGKPMCGSNVSLCEHVSTTIFCPSKPIIGSNVVQVNLLVLVMFLVQVNQFTVVVFVQVNPFVLLIFVQVNQFVLVMFVQVDL